MFFIHLFLFMDLTATRKIQFVSVKASRSRFQFSNVLQLLVLFATFFRRVTNGEEVQDPRVYLPDFDNVGATLTQDFYYQIEYDLGTVCESTFRSDFAASVQHILVDAAEEIYFIQFGLNLNNATPATGQCAIDLSSVTAASFSNISPTMRMKSRATAVVNSGNPVGINFVDSEGYSIGLLDTCDTPTHTESFINNVSIEEDIELKFAHYSSSGCGLANCDVTQYKGFNDSDIEDNTADCEYSIEIRYSRYDVAFLGTMANQLSWLDQGGVDQLGLFYKIVRQDPLTAISYASSLITIERLFNQGPSTEPCQLHELTPAVPRPFPTLSFSLTSGVPEHDLLISFNDVNNPQFFQIADLLTAQPGVYTYVAQIWDDSNTAITAQYTVELTVKYYELDQYTQIESVVDLSLGEHMRTYTPPLFKLGTETGLELTDVSDPARMVYFKVQGFEDALMTPEFVSVEIVDNSDYAQVTVKFTKVATCTLDTFVLLLCYSYGSVTTLQGLCNTSRPIHVSNALGSCFTDALVSVDPASASQIEAQDFTINVGVPLDESHVIFDLGAIVTTDSAPACGSLAFRLVDQTQEQFIRVTLAGEVTLVTVFDSALLGTHTVQFELFLQDADQGGLHPQPIDLTLEVLIQQQPIVATTELDIGLPEQEGLPDELPGEILTEEQELMIESMTQSLIREAPVPMNPIAPLYFCFFDEVCYFSFSFADPLAQAIEAGQVTDGELVPQGIKITVVQSTIAYASTQDVEYMEAVGFGRITLMLDGKSARSSNSRADVVDGYVLVSVQDVSPGGLTSEFRINFMIKSEEQEQDQSSKSGAKEGAAVHKKSNKFDEMVEQARMIISSLQTQFEGLQAEEPTVKVSQISPIGLVDINFSQEMFVPDTVDEPTTGRLLEQSEATLIEAFKAKKMLQVELIDKSESDLRLNKNFDWHVSSYTENKLQIQLSFEEPLAISSAQTGRDQIKVKFLDTQMIFNGFGVRLPNFTEISFAIPPQYASSTEAQIFQAAVNTFQTVNANGFTSSLLLNLFIAGILHQIWALSSSQQIIIIMPLFAVVLPASAETLFHIMLQIAAFEMVPSDDIFEGWLQRLEAVGGESDVLTEKVASLGFESTWFIPNLGSILFVIPFYLALLAFLLLSRYTCCCVQRRIETFQVSLRSNLLWNWPIDFLKNSFSVIMICCLLNITHSEWSLDVAAVNSAFAAIVFAVLFAYPSLIQLYLFRHKQELDTKAFKSKFAAAYEGLQVTDNKFLLQPVFFLYRRIFVPMIVIVYPTLLISQFIVLTFTTLSTIIMLGYTMPFSSAARNKAEFVEEVAILILMYHFLCFSDWMTDMQTRQELGFSVIAIILIQIGAHIVANLYLAILGLRQRLRRTKTMRKAKEMAKMQREKNKTRIKAYLKRVPQRRREQEQRENDVTEERHLAEMAQIKFDLQKKLAEQKTQQLYSQQTFKPIKEELENDQLLSRRSQRGRGAYGIKLDEELDIEAIETDLQERTDITRQLLLNLNDFKLRTDGLDAIEEEKELGSSMNPARVQTKKMSSTNPFQVVTHSVLNKQQYLGFGDIELSKNASPLLRPRVSSLSARESSSLSAHRKSSFNSYSDSRRCERLESRLQADGDLLAESALGELDKYFPGLVKQGQMLRQVTRQENVHQPTENCHRDQTDCESPIRRPGAIHPISPTNLIGASAADSNKMDQIPSKRPKITIQWHSTDF